MIPREGGAYYFLITPNNTQLNTAVSSGPQHTVGSINAAIDSVTVTLPSPSDAEEGGTSCHLQNET